MSVFIDNAQGGLSLVVARALGREGIEVSAGTSSKDAMTFHSKYCNTRHTYPSPTNDDGSFINELVKTVKKNRNEVLFTLGGRETQQISENRDKLTPYVKFPFVEHEKLMMLQDKASTLKLALENQIPCPKTHFISDLKDVKALRDKLNYPVVIKPRVSSGSKGLVYINSKDKLVSSYQEIHSSYPYPLIQEYIPHGGPTYGFEALFNQDSELRAHFIHKRIREYPITGGPSTMRVSAENEKIKEYGEKLLKSIGWYGLAMAEFKVDPRTGEPLFMEVNPRFWGSLNLAIVSGVNFPHLLYKMATEGDVKPVTKYRLNVKGRWLIWGDVNHLLSVMKGKRTEWGYSSPNRLRTLLEFMRFYDKDLHYDLLSLDDPHPVIHKILSSVR